jgi:hypothetical protein
MDVEARCFIGQHLRRHWIIDKTNIDQRSWLFVVHVDDPLVRPSLEPVANGPLGAACTKDDPCTAAPSESAVDSMIVFNEERDKGFLQRPAA